jgi:hypothetical protein
MRLPIFMFTAVFLASTTVAAQPTPDGGSNVDDETNQAAPTVASPPPPIFTFGGYAEAVYQWNFNAPSNGITNFRGFDNRHHTVTISNVVLDTSWDYQGLIGRVALQVGHTPSTYYLAEPSAPGASGANATGAELWKYVQQAYVG